MRPIAFLLLNSLGFLLIAASYPSNAAVLRQNFELTVTRSGLPSGDQTSVAPPIGTKGFGSYTYDESQVNYVEPRYSPVGYYLGKPRDIAFLDFSINFFNRTYTQLASISTSRVDEYLRYTLTPTGQYTPQTMILLTYYLASEGNSILTFNGNSFSYTFSNQQGYVAANAGGTFRFTDVEPVPEPSLAIVPIVALGLECLWHRKRL